MFFDHPIADAIATGSLLSGVALVWVIVTIRLVGLRSLSKMTNFDFVTTVATGSLLAGAGQVGDWPALVKILAAIAAVFGAQYIMAQARLHSETIENAVANTPVILMRDGVILHDALTRTRVARSDLIAKLREANVLHLSDVRAVVLESTGDLSVLHGADLEPALLDGVQGH
jgi:uncharacterized membrane protein YcaP (DUF421 family)